MAKDAKDAKVSFNWVGFTPCNFLNIQPCEDEFKEVTIVKNEISLASSGEGIGWLSSIESNTSDNYVKITFTEKGSGRIWKDVFFKHVELKT